jgi:hypothetical protein
VRGKCRHVNRGTISHQSAAIVVGSVAVLLTVCLVVLPVARDQIVQGKPVMTGGEVDALLGLTFLVAVDLGAAEETVATQWFARRADPAAMRWCVVRLFEPRTR